MKDENKTLQEGENNQVESTTVDKGKTFTQDEVNKFVQERLNKERMRFDGERAKWESVLTQRELILEAREELSKRGLAPELLEALNCTSKEALEKSLEIISKVATTKKPDENVRIVTVDTGGNFTGLNESQDSKLRSVMGLK